MTVLKDNENEEISKEDIDLIQGYLANWKKLQDKIKYFIPEEFYNQKIITSTILCFLMLSF